MATNARTLYLDNETYGNLGLLAGLKQTSRSSVLRTMINQEFSRTRQWLSLPEERKDSKGIRRAG